MCQRSEGRRIVGIQRAVIIVSRRGAEKLSRSNYTRRGDIRFRVEELSVVWGRGSQIKSRWRSEKNAIMCRKMRDSRRGCIVSRICDLMKRCTIFVCESESFEISLEILFLFLVYTLSRIVYKLYMIRVWMYKMKKNDWGCRERANLKQKFGIFGGESRGRVISCEMRNNW